MKISAIMNQQADPENPKSKDELGLLTITQQTDAQGVERVYLTLTGEGDDYYSVRADMLDPRFTDTEFMSGWGYYEALRKMIASGMTFEPGMRQKRTVLYAMEKYSKAPANSMREIVHAGTSFMTLEQCEKICAFIIKNFQDTTDVALHFDVPADYAEEFVTKCMMQYQNGHS